jgi:hypothetical protein
VTSHRLRGLMTAAMSRGRSTTAIKTDRWGVSTDLGPRFREAGSRLTAGGYPANAGPDVIRERSNDKYDSVMTQLGYGETDP